MVREPRWLTLRGLFWSKGVGERWLTFDMSQVQYITTSLVDNGYGHETLSVLIRVPNRDIQWMCADADEQKRRYDWLVYEVTRPTMGDCAPIEDITNNLEDI